MQATAAGDVRAGHVEALGVLARSPLHLLHRIGQIAEQCLVDELGESGITLCQFLLLSSIAGNEGASQTTLVGLTGIDRSTMADVALRLQRQGLIKRRRARHDRRALQLFLSDNGNRILLAVTPAVARAEEAWLSALSDKERDHLLAGLTAIFETHTAGFDIQTRQD